MCPSDTQIGAAIDQARRYERRAESSPEEVAADLPRLVELLDRDAINEREMTLRRSVLRSIHCITEQNPTELCDQYPVVVERALDTPESRVLARHVLHRGATLVSDNVPLELICETLADGLDESVDDLHQLHDDVPGHGATAMHLHQQASDRAEVLTGRRRLVMEALTDAFGGLVKYRAEQRGIDPIDGFVDLQAEYLAADEQAASRLGFGPDGSVVDIVERGELHSETYARWYLLNGCLASMLVLLVERTEPQILRTEAVIAERIH